MIARLALIYMFDKNRQEKVFKRAMRQGRQAV
jgi:hypothetical protein